MKYSVIIPAYQCAETLEQTVLSVLNSGLSDFEIILVDDGSKDSTPEICDCLAKKHTEVVCIHKENGGVSSARNRGIDEAKGDYLLFMDADDEIDEGSLKEPCEKIDEFKPDILFFGLSFDYLSSGKVYRRDEMVYPDEGIFSPVQWSEIFSDLFRYNALSPVWNKFYKTEIIKKHGIYFDKNVFLMEDFLFVLNCMQKTETIYMYNKVIYRYFQPENETRAYSRIKRIADINSFIEPFTKSIQGLNNYLNEQYNILFPQGEEVLLQLYLMFISQKAYYADIETLKNLSQTIKNGIFADFDIDDVLIRDLKNENYKAIIKRHKKIQLRHKIAVAVKKNPLYRKLKGN